jgi:hypothetical protein
MESSAFWGYRSIPFQGGFANDRSWKLESDLPAAQAAQLYQQLDALELDIAHRATAQVGARELLTKLRPPWWRASRSRGAQIGILTSKELNLELAQSKDL